MSPAHLAALIVAAIALRGVAQWVLDRADRAVCAFAEVTDEVGS